jgi:uncharacterized protein DUF4142
VRHRFAVPVATAHTCRGPGNSCSEQERGGDRKCQYHGASPWLCYRVLGAGDRRIYPLFSIGANWPEATTDKTSSELKGLISSGKVKVELPTALDSSHQSKLDKLKGEGGQDFSSEFDSIQTSAHKDAVSLFERYAKGGDNPDLKDWAGKTLPALKHHLEMAQDLGKKK